MRLRYLYLALPLLVSAACYTNTYGDEYESCDDLNAALTEEVSALVSCTADAECGEPLKGSSCGCTNELVARKGVNVGRYNTLKQRWDSMECAPKDSGPCACPEATGFLCVQGTCTWKYKTP